MSMKLIIHKNERVTNQKYSKLIVEHDTGEVQIPRASPEANFSNQYLYMAKKRPINAKGHI